MRPQHKLLSFFMLKNISYQKEETSKTDDIIDKPGAIFF